MKIHQFSSHNLARSTSEKGFNQSSTLWSMHDWITALTGEIGETANIIKKLNRERDGINGNRESSDELRANLAAEIADVYIYADQTLQAAGSEINADYDVTFAELSEIHSIEFAFERVALSNSELITKATAALGRAARIVEEATPQPGVTKFTSHQRASFQRAIMQIIYRLDLIAQKFEIDLGKAVISKFNATSRKIGYPITIE